MSFTPTVFNEGAAPGISAAELNKLGTQYAEAVAAVANGANMPTGAIIMWSGLLSAIPTGWHLCDGTSGTPNLIDKFVKGVATAVTNPGATGGAVNKTTAGHTHTQPAHTHTNPVTGAPSDLMYNKYGSSGGAFASSDIHTHNVADTGSSGGDNTDSQTDTIADIRPPYYEIAYIMKI